MKVFVAVFTLIVALALIYILKYIFEYIQFRAKLKQFRQLKNITYYLLNCNSEVAMSDFKLDNQVKKEAGWVYTKYFYFDLNDGKVVLSRIKDYFFEYYAYFLTEERWKGPELEKEVFTFGALLESKNILKFDSKKIQCVFRNIPINSKNPVVA